MQQGGTTCINKANLFGENWQDLWWWSMWSQIRCQRARRPCCPVRPVHVGFSSSSWPPERKLILLQTEHQKTVLVILSGNAAAPQPRTFDRHFSSRTSREGSNECLQRYARQSVKRHSAWRRFPISSMSDFWFRLKHCGGGATALNFLHCFLLWANTSHITYIKCQRWTGDNVMKESKIRTLLDSLLSTQTK